MHKSGFRIDYCHHGDWEITYFGQFSTSTPSQTLYIRNYTDLCDLYKRLGKEIEIEKKALEGLEAKSTDG